MDDYIATSAPGPAAPSYPRGLSIYIVIARFHPPAAMEVELQRLQPRVIPQRPQNRHQHVVVHEPPLIVRHRVRVQAGCCVLELKTHVSDEGEVDGADGFDELVDNPETEFAPFVLPEGTEAGSAPAEEEAVFAVQDAARFRVDLAAGA